MKKKLSTAAVVAIAALALSTFAMAAGLVRTSVNWKGEPVGEVSNPLPTSSPAADAGEASPHELAELALLREISMDEEDVDIVFISYREADGSYGCVSTLHEKTFGSLSALRAAVDRSGLLPMPSFIPEGYDFVVGSAFYAVRPDTPYALLSQEETPDGLTISRLGVDEGEAFVRGYYMYFENAEGRMLWGTVTLEENSDDLRMVLESGDDAKPMSVPGMDDALLLVRLENVDLLMRRALDATIPYATAEACLGPEWRPQVVKEAPAYAEIRFDWHADALDADALAEMFAEK